MPEAPDTTATTTEQTTTALVEPKIESPAPASSDTTDTSTDEGSILNPKSGDDALTTETTEAATENPLFGAPEEGTDYTLKGLPKGVTIDSEALAAVAPVARELNLSNDGLSKLVGVYAETVLPRVTQQITDQVNTDVAALRSAWATDARAAVLGGTNAAGETVTPDPIFGGKPLKDVQTVAARALDRFGGAEFREFIDANGLGNHPQMLRFAYQAGALIGEDTELPRGGDPADKPKTREEKYYKRTT